MESKLSKHTNVFAEFGIESTNDLNEIDENDLDAMKLPQLHKKRFRTALEARQGKKINKGVTADPSLLQFLKDADLNRYIQDFMKIGITSVEHLDDLSEKDLDELGMLKMEKKRFWKKIQNK